MTEFCDSPGRKLRKNEKATISIRSRVENDAFHMIEIEILNVIQSIPIWEIDTDTRLDHAEKLRLSGNEYFKVGAYITIIISFCLCHLLFKCHM